MSEYPENVLVERPGNMVVFLHVEDLFSGDAAQTNTLVQHMRRHVTVEAADAKTSATEAMHRQHKE